MTEPHIHASHPALIKRLKRANGHLSSVIAMLEEGQPCLAVAQQLHAVEKAIQQAKKALIQDHIDHCLEHAVSGEHGHAHDLSEFKEITKYL
ncbi:metal-sensing transcriptional repressor [Comamonas aquatica]|uniref:Metal-sensing transcriptional repressor n=1 Tax=Comamonas aquatica TaxID=225991 RepID=A0AA42I0Q9_9BURK|nr:metal-sensing transcriptional repressor [Comamonas aquatica]MDH0365152.1 metal-sensing transcriptional repressor [Comamonas aquatica]